LAWVVSVIANRHDQYRLALSTDLKRPVAQGLALELKDAGDTSSAIAELMTAKHMLPNDYEIGLPLQSLLPKSKTNLE
jgi:hypothetical protein